MEPISQFGSGQAQFKDRRTGLIVFGIIEILCAAACLGLVGLLILGQAMSARINGAGTTFRMVLPAIFIYVLLAGLFLALGIGSIRARRWARAFALIVAWSWLVIGGFTALIEAFLLPRVLGRAAPGGPGLPPAAQTMVLVITIGFLIVFMVVLPLALVLFYRSNHVHATCETADPGPCWTDRAPLPVLGLSCWLLLGALGMMLMPLAYSGVLPFFGTLISGVPGTIFYACFGLLFLYLARAVYQLNPAAWWFVLAATVVVAISNLLTFSRIDLIEMYRRMGYPETQIKQLQEFNFTGKSWALIGSCMGLLPALGYLLYVRKFFRPGAPAPK